MKESLLSGFVPLLAFERPFPRFPYGSPTDITSGVIYGVRLGESALLFFAPVAPLCFYSGEGVAEAMRGKDPNRLAVARR